MGLLGMELKALVVSGIILAVAVGVALIAYFILFLALNRGAERADSSIVDKSIVAHAKRPAFVLFPLVAVLTVLPYLRVPAEPLDDLRHAVVLCMIAATAWLAVSLTAVFDDFVSSKFKIDVSDNLLARRVHTRTRVLRRIAINAILIVAVSAMFMTFPSIRNIGLSIFASAGVAGLIIGIAARPMLANIIAGIQIAVTQPIKIDDVVVLEGKWGRIEEINSSHVIVCLWDLRRLVVPLSYLIERPFQNWTYRTADILGAVVLYTDYSVPVEALRGELHRLLQSSDLWDGNAWSLEVTNATERSMELRALVSASDSAALWNLRCYIRENLLRFMQERYPQSLPKMRAEIREHTRLHDEGA